MLDIVDALAWTGAGLSLSAALMKTMIPLRVLAASTNVAFITYGILAWSYLSSYRTAYFFR